MTEPAQVWNHDRLAVDLARWLKSGGENWVWLNSALGEWKGPRPDVMAYRRFRYERPVVRAFEAKVSRSDLLSDLNSEKWRSYLEHCESVTFIMPSGLCKKEEIPAECGVMFRSARGWRTERRPQPAGNPISVVAMAKLLTMHPLVIRPELKENSWQRDDWRRRADSAFLQQIGEKHGRHLANYLRLVAEGKDPVSDARDKAAAILADAKADAARLGEELKPVLTALGLDPATPAWQLSSAIRARADALSRDGQLAAVRHGLAKASAALEHVHVLALSAPESAAA